MTGGQEDWRPKRLEEPVEPPSFNEKVKLNVKDNFDRSCQMYNGFEEKYHFFASLSLKLTECINLKQAPLCWMWDAVMASRHRF